MVRFCKCAHDNEAHSRKKHYPGKPCTVCDCQDYTGQNNKLNMFGFIASLILFLTTIALASFMVFVMIDIINSLPDPSAIDEEHSIEETVNLMLILFIGGLLLGIGSVMMFDVTMDCRSRYLRPIKSL